MSTFDLVPELAARLDALVPLEPPRDDWHDVLRASARDASAAASRSGSRSQPRCSWSSSESQLRRISSYENTTPSRSLVPSVSR